MSEPGVREQDTAVRRRHLRRRTRVVVAAGAVVAAAGVTAALLATSDSPAPSALAVVTGALAKTSAESYSFSLDTTVRFAGRAVHSDVVSGTFDPGHELGTELLNTSGIQGPVRAQIRFIGKYVYTWISAGSGLGTIGKPWDKAPVPHAGTNEMPGGPYGFASDQPVSPAELSVVLRSAGTIRDGGPVSDPGWTGTKYTFTASLADGREPVSVTAYVDQQGRVRRLVTITTAGRRTTNRDLTFGDFSTPVSVTAPAVTQFKYTSTPYWGFYF